MISADRVTEDILATGVSPLALEEGASLVESFITRHAALTTKIIAVERGWSVQVDERTWAIGVMDVIMEDARGIFGKELKTTREPNRYWSEEKWLDEIGNGHQIAFYALALARGAFYDTQGVRMELNLATPVRMQVEACVKTAVPQFWPADERDSWFTFDEVALTAVVNAIKLKAIAIRESRRSGAVPWQLTGKQCFAYNRYCDFFDLCKRHAWPAAVAGFQASDPAAQYALPFLPAEAREADAVIISASSYDTYSRCMELGRLEAQSEGKGASMALDIGTVFHAGAASMHRQLQESQTQE